jgi:predicted Zn-dependent protease
VEGAVNRARALVAALAGALAAACTDPMVPSHAPAYPFDAFGEVFHWPADRLPVRFYADPRGTLRTLVAHAVDSWERQFLYGEFRGVMVNDSNAADVIVIWADSVPPDATPDNGPAVNACGGLTQGFLDSTGMAFDGPFHTQLTVLTGAVFTPGQVQACMRRTTIHELGHTLGLFQESPDSVHDIMAAPPRVNLPSAGDRRTVETLYHTAPTLGPPPL